MKHDSKREIPGASGEGDYYHVILRGKEKFKKFRTQDVGSDGHSMRVAGQLRDEDRWQTQKLLFAKDDAYIVNGYLHSDREKTKNVLASFESVPRHIEGDRFYAKPGHQ